MTAVAVFLVMPRCTVQAGELRSDILQAKSDRLYFPHGREKLIFARSRFTLYNDNDSLCSGLIEFSGPGVSYSAPIYSLPGLLNIGSLYALIETAEIDSVSTIRIGINLPDRRGLSVSNGRLFEESNPPLKLFSDNGNPFEIVFYDSFLEMTLALEAHRIDGFISFKEYRPSGGDIVTTAHPFDYFAALIPNVSRSVNRRGILSTSLYYRFGPSQSSAYFTGDGVRPFNRLYMRGGDGPRFYEYNPGKGRRLLKSLDGKPKEISIAISETMLTETGNYFIDILNRDRIKCRLDRYRENYDLYLDFVPVSPDDPSVGLKYISRVVASDAPAGDEVNETLRIIENYIELGDGAADRDAAMYYYERAERGLVDDIGVFPLFQPTIYVTSYDYIRNFDYEIYVRDELKSISRIILPGRGDE